MATTTPNFGWPVPTSGDLIKNGATAIEALGDAIDASLVDLEGGTTGQILAKNSNTDMDFIWIANDQGDITGVTAGTGLTGGGTSGAVSLAFDQANYGGGQYAAGKNKVINGAFDVWQRGTTVTNPGIEQYFADRFYYVTNNSGGSVTLTRQPFTGTDIPVAGAQYYFRNVGASPTGQAYSLFGTKIENVQTFAGQSVTLSFYAKADATRSTTPTVYQQFGSGGSTLTTTTGSAISLTTSWARYTQTINVPSISGKTIGTSSYLQFELSQPTNTSYTTEFYGIQIEAGSTATPFQTATGTIQGELAACQRYYYRTGGDALYQALAMGRASSTTNIQAFFQVPVTLRVAATSVDFSTLVGSAGTSGVQAVTSLTINQTGKTMIDLSVTSSGAVYVNGSTGQIQTNNSLSGYLAVSAEL
jgi:hypothetical protein